MIRFDTERVGPPDGGARDVHEPPRRPRPHGIRVSTVNEAVRAVRPGPVFLGLVAVTAFGGWLLTITEPGRGVEAVIGAILLLVGGWVISLCLHEFAHAITAYAFGDHGVEVRGYLTLDPRKYAHPGMSVVFPLVIVLMGGIGLPGGAVYVNKARMTRRQRSLVSAAGPLTNILLAIILMIVIRDLAGTTFESNFWWTLSALANLQVIATVLNLLPIPGLDGFGIVEPWLSVPTQIAAERMAPFGFLLLLAALFFVPPVRDGFYVVTDSLFGLSGINPVMAAYGWWLVLFWR